MPMAVGELAFYLYLSVCFLRDIPKTNTAMITEHDKEMFHGESRKPIYFGSKVQRSKSQNTKTLSASVFTPL